jgi:Fe-Mn family superoxide dismutase
VWLVSNNGKLEIMKTANADNPLTHGKAALMVSDVWEHAYYIDYRNERPKFLKTFLEHLVDWEAAAARLEEKAPSAKPAKSHGRSAA